MIDVTRGEVDQIINKELLIFPSMDKVLVIELHNYRELGKTHVMVLVKDLKLNKIFLGKIGGQLIEVERCENL